MYQALLAEASLPLLLLKIDEELAAEARAGACRACGARVDVADFPRKVRGGPWKLDASHDRRFSFCCARQGCCRRLTPPSVRFIERHVYFSVVVVLAGLLFCGATSWRIAHLSEKLGVSRRTLVRWRTWWRELSRSPLWRRMRGRIPAFIPGASLPLALHERLVGDDAARVVALTTWLAPLSASKGLREGRSRPAEFAH